MSTRHLELLRDLSTQRREREELQRREEQRLRKREALLRDRLLSKGRTSSVPPLEPPPPLGSAPAAAPPPSLAPPSDETPADERRQWQLRCNSDIERRQEEAIQKVRHCQRLEQLKREREQLKKQWLVHRAQSYLLDKCSNPELKEFLESRAQKPRALPKLPVLNPRAPADLVGPSDEDQDTQAGGGARSATDEFAASRPPSGMEGLVITAVRIGFRQPQQQQQQAAQPQLAVSPSKPTLAAAAKGVNSFLSRLRLTRMRSSCGSLSEWKHRNGCAPDQKVFICCGGYPDFRDALLRRGWFQNEDKGSRHFDFKWGMQPDIHHDLLLPDQVVNHYGGCRDLTTKVGLTLNLRNSVWLCGVEMDEFYPRAFDLYDPLDRAEFVLNFKHSKAEAILRGFLRDVEAKPELTFSPEVVAIALKVCMRLVTDVDDIIDCAPMAEELGCVPASEWEVLQQVNLDDVSQRLEGSLNDETLENLIQKKSTRPCWSWRPGPNDKRRALEEERDAERRARAEKEGKKKKKKQKKEEEPVPLSAPLASFDTSRGRHLVEQARGVIEELCQKSRQHCINGSRNAWIVKPSGKSRGRGIQVMRELDEIFKTTESDGFQWICQKYIEQPQLLHGYKFDMRQWVLVTDWNPLTVYVWRHPYLRFAGQKYDDTLADRSEFRHLTNNSIIHYMDGFAVKNEDLQTSGYMWFKEQYQEYLHNSLCKCEKHYTPWLKPPPYTCESFGVRWEDVMFVAREEDDDEDEAREDGEQDDDESDDRTRTLGRTAFTLSTASTAEPSDSSSAGGGSSSPAEPTATGSLTPAASERSVASSRRSPRGPAPDGAAAGRAASPAAPMSPKPSARNRPPAAEAAGGARKGIVEEVACPPCDPDPDDGAQTPCEDLWESCLRPQINDIIKWSLMSVADEIKHRKNTFELYGYDFMVSTGGDKPKAWLIEVNSSPACDYSTPVTCPLVKKMMEDIAKVTVDLKENPESSTGEWEMLQHEYNKTVNQRVRSCPDLVVTGKEIQAPKGLTKKKAKKKRKGSKKGAPEASRASDVDADCDGEGDEESEAEEGDDGD